MITKSHGPPGKSSDLFSSVFCWALWGFLPGSSWGFPENAEIWGPARLRKQGIGYIALYWVIFGLYWGYLGIMEKNMETKGGGKNKLTRQFLVCWAREMCRREKCRAPSLHTPLDVSGRHECLHLTFSRCAARRPKPKTLNPKP